MVQRLQITSSGEGKSLYLLHGWGVNSAIFEPIVSSLNKHFNVVLVDLPGFGDNTDTYPQPYELATVANTVAEIIEPNAILLGWSLGGLVASKIALHHPHKVAKLVTVASSPYFLESTDWLGIKATVLANFHQQLTADISKTLNGFLKLQAMGSPHIRDDIRLIKQLVDQKPQPNQFVLDQGLNILADADLRQQLHKVEQPFLRIYGKLDSLVPFRVIDTINRLAPKSKSIILEKASHAPFISHQTEFIHNLLRWLEHES